MSLVLASGSETRANVLSAAGVDIEIVPSSIDEAPFKEMARADGIGAAALAALLADAKAGEVAARLPGRLVLGADQVLAFEGGTLDKAENREQARTHLRRLRGETHELISAAVLMRGDAVLWQGSGTVQLTMRAFSDDFLERYLDVEGEAVLWSVGGYRIEGQGAQLFERIEGDYFSILGLPLLKVLAALRGEGEMPL